MKKKHLFLHFTAKLIAILLVSLNSVGLLYAAPSAFVTIDDITYKLTTRYTSYVSSSTLLNLQPWWSDSALSLKLAEQVQYSLGDINGNYPANSPFSVLFAYDNDVINASTSVTFWDGFAVTDCPSCPNNNDNYAYVIASQIIYAYTLADIRASLNSSNLGLQSTLATTDILVNGAHSRPMSRRVDAGKKTFWVAGDWGNDNHHERDGRIGLTEVGGGYNFGPAQMNISLGKTWASQDLIHNGDVDSDGKYIMVEGILPLSVDNGIYATIGTYYHWGEMDIDRGYLNMGNLDQSSASPDTDTWGVRARVDWENAFTISIARFSPYADLWHSKTKLDSYTETGGGFPAHFNSREDRITELRAGLNAAMPINQSNFDFVANIEGVHRFDDKADSTSGQVVGLFAFNLEGEDYDQNWLKGGVGIEGVMGDGKVSLMLNGTTKGEMANSWVAASYQMAF